MKLILLFCMISCLVGCSYKTYRLDQSEVILSAQNKESGSTSAGNFVTTAIKKVHDLDIVLYPTDLLKTDGVAVIKKEMTEMEIEQLMSIYPDMTQDQFIIGTMNGKAIKELIIGRVQDSYRADLQVAGVIYEAQFVGGIGRFNVEGTDGIVLEDDKYYRVAVSNFFYFSGATFPSYKYRNNLSFALKQEEKVISAREAMKQYLKEVRQFPYLDEVRAKVSSNVRGDAGTLPIYTIQGDKHRSPYYGHKVKTKGIVTAVAGVGWFPGGVDVYIQSERGDANIATSDAIHLYFEDESVDIEMGDELEVSGIVYEQMTKTGMSRTSIREISGYKVLGKKRSLPAPVKIGSEGRSIPNKNISTYNGDLNKKTYLNLTDGIDFYESIEGMRVTLKDPRVLGFRGGKEDSENARGKPKGYLNLYIIADGNQKRGNFTSKGGIVVNEAEEDYNPEIITLVTNHLTKGVSNHSVFAVGDVVKGDITGILSYEKNIFGDGEYTLVLPESQEAFNVTGSKKVVPLEDRPKTTLTPEKDKITISSFNVENLAGNQRERLREIADAISVTLKCPDILNLVEVQDLNNAMFTGGPSGEVTLNRLINQIDCGDAVYKSVNVDPINHAEGGQPGGNIRVSMIYNSSRVNFNYREIPDSLAETIVMENGSINHNPGRVFPNDPAFARTRKSIVAEFEFKGERFFVIGNHFKSKLGDTSRWAAQQPPVLNTNIKRSELASRVNDFVEILNRQSPGSHVVVLGDFNALIEEDSMKVLAGRELVNLMSYGNLVPVNDRYTSNYNGSSQPLDYIFASKSLLNKNPEFEVLHINSDYMGRLSDHDPLVARFEL